MRVEMQENKKKKDFKNIEAGDIFTAEGEFGEKEYFLVVESEEGYLLVDLSNGLSVDSAFEYILDIGPYMNGYTNPKHYRGDDCEMIIKGELA